MLWQLGEGSVNGSGMRSELQSSLNQGNVRQPCNSVAPAWACAGFGIGAVSLLHYYVCVFLLQAWKMQAVQENQQEHCVERKLDNGGGCKGPGNGPPG